MKHAFRAKFQTKPPRPVDVFGLLWKQACTRPTALPDIENWPGLLVLECIFAVECLSLCVNVYWAG